jgi:hypothetical protein
MADTAGDAGNAAGYPAGDAGNAAGYPADETADPAAATTGAAGG